MKVPSSIILVLYIVAGFATFGWIFNTTEDTDQCYMQTKTQRICWKSPDRAMAGVVGGLGWPVYWAGRLAIEWVKP